MILQVRSAPGCTASQSPGKATGTRWACAGSPAVRDRAACMPDGTRCLGPSVRFERYERQMAWDKHSGMANRSDAGGLDVIYSVRNWARLALAEPRQCCW